MLPPAHRLRRSVEIKQVRQDGRSWRHPLLIFVIMPNERTTSRFAFVASRLVGTAVARNRAKRLLREVVRRYLPTIEPGWDCVLIARPAIAGASLAAVETAVCQLLQRAQLQDTYNG